MKKQIRQRSDYIKEILVDSTADFSTTIGSKIFIKLLPRYLLKRFVSSSNHLLILQIVSSFGEVVLS